MSEDGIFIPCPRIYVPAEYAEAPPRGATEGNEDIYKAPPNSAQQFIVRPSSHDLDLAPLSLPELRLEAANVGFENGFVGMSLIAGRLWSIWQDGQKQLELAQEIFGEVEIVHRYRRFLEQYPRGVLFSQQQLFVAQRMLIQHARPATVDEDLTDNEAVSLARVLVAAHDIIDAAHGRLAEGEADLIDVVAYTVQSGAYSSRPAQLNEFGRAYDIFFIRARQHVDERAPLDEWAQADVNLSLEEQLAGGFGFNATASKSEQNPNVPHAMLEPPILSKTQLADAEERLLNALAAPRSWFREKFDQGEQNIRDVAWEVQPFMRRPFLRIESGKLALSSPGAMADWLGFGLYDRLRESAKERRTKKNDTLSLFGQVYGDLVEDYVLDVVKSVFPDGVYGDEPYGRGGGLRTPDVAIDRGRDLVLVEVRSGFLSPWFRTSGDVDEFADQLNRLVFRKLGQLGGRLADLKLKTATIGDIDMDAVDRVWPILITADMTITEHLWTLMNGALPAALKTDDVQHLVIGDVEDLELLMGLVEDGHDLVEMLEARQKSAYVELELKRWVLEELKASSLTRPKIVLENWQRASAAMNNALWPGVAAELLADDSLAALDLTPPVP